MKDTTEEKYERKKIDGRKEIDFITFVRSPQAAIQLLLSSDEGQHFHSWINSSKNIYILELIKKLAHFINNQMFLLHKNHLKRPVPLK